MSSYKPKIKVESTNAKRLLEIASIAGIIHIVYILLRGWGDIPDRIPSHYGVDGRPDAYAGRESLLILPAIGLIIYIVMIILERYPHLFNYMWRITPENARRQYRLAVIMLAVLKAEIIWIFNYITLATINISLGRAEGLSPLFLPAMLALIFGPICVYLFISYKER